MRRLSGHSLCQWRSQPDGGYSRPAPLAQENRLPICGKDFKTGQTLMKTILAPGLKARMLGLSGWFSTNILGNRDGEVLDDPGFLQDQGRKQALGAGVHPAAGPLSRSLQGLLPQGADQLLSAARRQQRRLGQHRHLRMAWLSHADQDRFPVPRLAFWPRRSSWIWSCFWICAARAGMRPASRNGSHSISRAPWCAPQLYPEHDCSSSS